MMLLRLVQRSALVLMIGTGVIVPALGQTPRPVDPAIIQAMWTYDYIANSIGFYALGDKQTQKFLADEHSPCRSEKVESPPCAGARHMLSAYSRNRPEIEAMFSQGGPSVSAGRTAAQRAIFDPAMCLVANGRAEYAAFEIACGRYILSVMPRPTYPPTPQPTATPQEPTLSNKPPK